MAPANTAGLDRVLRKVTWRLIPFMALLYFINYLDRVNVGFAALTMNQDLAFSATVYGNGAGILFFGYVLFQVPSNIALAKVGVRRWTAGIMIVWGLVSAAMALVTGPFSFYALRFLLGVAEAGFFPGMILYLTHWFPEQTRGKIAAAFMMAIPLSSVLGGPASTALLGIDALTLHGWQWLFFLQGLPAVLLGLAVFGVLTETPADARWLGAEDKRILIEALARERAYASAEQTPLRDVLLNGRIWLFGLMYFGIVICLYGLTLWSPQIIKSFGGLTNFEVGLVATIPYGLAAICMYFWGAHSDATGERTWHVALPAFCATVGLSATGYFSDAPILALVTLSLGAVGVYAALPMFWSLPTAALRGTQAVAGIALINAVGNSGGYFGPALIGYVKEATDSYAAALIVLGAFAAMAGILALRMGPKVTPAMDKRMASPQT